MLEAKMFADFRRLLVIPALGGLAWYGLHRFKNEVGGSEPLTFEDAPVSFELLKLNDGN